MVEQDNKIFEAELIEKARSGDPGSFSALVERYQQRAVHTAFGLVGNLEDARDMAQEAFVKAYERLDGFRSESGFYTWFYRILVNTCKDFLRKQKMRRTFSFWLGKDEEEEDPAQKIEDHAENAADAASHRDLGRAVNEAMEKLPFRQKSVFALRYLEGQSLEEISQSLDISVGTVKAHLWQACEKMRVALKGVWEND